MSDSYLTLASPSEAVFTEKRSKFLAFAFPAKTAAEVKEQVDALSRKYYDARHVGGAYLLGFDRTDFRANDNGEPSGTAGRPILGQINSLGLTDVCVAVVRYFGGIKLGTPGLIAAYRESARLALEAGDIVECNVTDTLEFTNHYAVMKDVMKAN
ncbi:MAG: YigZ family protein, partial [Muribaculaceae bacterium]|nr:YigZ family protein [Muribaculaceae bacterium]